MIALNAQRHVFTCSELGKGYAEEMCPKGKPDGNCNTSPRQSNRVCIYAPILL
jgi:hypothetical protein